MNYPHSHIKHMIFSFDKHNVTYFRVPKVASTSLLMTFRQLDNVEKVSNYDKDSFKFAFVRNPFDRLASCFRHVIQKGALQGIQGHPDLYREMTFDSFVDVISKIEVKNMDIHFRPQYTFIPETPDFLGKFENLDNDFSELCNKIKINAILIHKNKTDRIDYKTYYNSSTEEKVRKIYKTDFKLFNYKANVFKH